MKIWVSGAAALLLAGCASIDSPLDDGYQFGDATNTVLTLQAEYCATAEPAQRAIRLAALRAAGVPVPPSGACTDIMALVPEADLDVDVEQAEKDRERFEGRVNADRDTASSADDEATE